MVSVEAAGGMQRVEMSCLGEDGGWMGLLLSTHLAQPKLRRTEETEPPTRAAANLVPGLM